MRRLALAALWVVVTGSASVPVAATLEACRERPGDGEAAVALARDRARVARIVELDSLLDRTLKEADDASASGDDARAEAILEARALPAADAAIASAVAVATETPWGQARRAELLDVLKARRGAIPRYVEALRGDALEPKLAAVEAQLALQRRAMAAATAALTLPEGGGD